MPFRKRGRAKFSRRRPRRMMRRRIRGRKSFVHRQPGLIVPNSSFKKFKYFATHDQPSLAGSSTLTGLIRLSANSAYDINTLVSSSAMAGFTEWSAFYKRYRVMACSYRFTATNSISSTNNYPFYMGVVWDPSNTMGSAPSWNTLIESKGNFSGYNKQLLVADAASGASTKTIKGYVVLSKLFGHKPEYTADTTYSATTTSSPANIIYCNFYVASPDGVSNFPSSTIVNLEFNVYVKFYEKLNLTI